MRKQSDRATFDLLRRLCLCQIRLSTTFSPHVAKGATRLKTNKQKKPLNSHNHDLAMHPSIYFLNVKFTECQFIMNKLIQHVSKL